MQSGQLYLRRCLHYTDAFDDSFTFFVQGNIFFFLSELVTHVAKRMRNSKTMWTVSFNLVHEQSWALVWLSPGRCHPRISWPWQADVAPEHPLLQPCNNPNFLRLWWTTMKVTRVAATPMATQPGSLTDRLWEDTATGVRWGPRDSPRGQGDPVWGTTRSKGPTRGFPWRHRTSRTCLTCSNSSCRSTCPSSGGKWSRQTVLGEPKNEDANVLSVRFSRDLHFYIWLGFLLNKSSHVSLTHISL